jgi:sporulation protein YlmC with PRC-barrel domain
MLITHLRPGELWGKKVYDTDGGYVGAVVAIGSRHGVVRKVVVQRPRRGLPLTLMPDVDARLDGSHLVVPLRQVTTRLRVVR